MSVLRQCGGKIPKNHRVYRVEHHMREQYVVSNSPANAALSCCYVERLTDREIMQAALEALGVK